MDVGDRQEPFSTRGKEYDCPVKSCRSTFKTKKELAAHKLTAHSYRPCVHSFCPCVFMSARRLAHHLSRCHGAGQASLIGQLQAVTVDFLQRVNRARETAEEQWSEAGRLTDREAAFMMHVVEAANRLTGAQSEKSEARQPKRKHKRRKRLREDDPPFVLSLPGLRTSSEGRRGPRPSLYSCEQCVKVFPYKKELKAHLADEHSEKQAEGLLELQLLPPTEADDGVYSSFSPRSPSLDSDLQPLVSSH